MIALGIGVYVCFLVIEIASNTIERPHRIQIDSTPIRVENGWVKLSGRARPGAAIEVLAGERQLCFAEADWRGRFTAEFSAPPEVHRIRVRVFDEDAPETEFLKIEGIFLERDPNSSILPRITLAYFIEEPRKLWVAGYGPPLTRLHILSAAGKLVAELQVDDQGLFDSLVDLPVPREPPAALLLNSQSKATAFRVARVRVEDLPLSRTADIEIRADGRPRENLRVTLPAAHPYFTLLEQGFITAEEFGKASFGHSYFRIDRTLISLRKTGNKGFVELGQIWPTVPPILHWYGSQGDGIGRYPLLTSNDWISVHFRGINPAWFGDPPPTQIADSTALWQGPIDAWNTLEIGFRVADLVPIYQRLSRIAPEDEATRDDSAKDEKTEDEKVRDVKFRDYIRRFSGQGGATLQSLWHQAILLIPFAGMIWLGARRPFSSQKTWRALTATASVLALWRVCAALFPFLLQPGERLLRLSLSNDGGRALAMRAFWIPFALFVAALPFLWRHLSTADHLPSQIPLAGGSLRRRLVFGFRSTYLLLTVLLYVAISSRVLQPEKFLDLSFLHASMNSQRVSLTICICLVLSAFGFRALLMGTGFALVVWRQFAEFSDAPLLSQRLSFDMDWLERLPREVVLLIAVFAACPFLLLLVRKLTHPFLGRRQAWLLTAAMLLTALLAPHLSVRSALILSGSLLLFGFGGIVLRLLLSAEPRKPWIEKIETRPRVIAGALFLLAVLLAWPLADPAKKLEFWDVQNLNFQIQDLFVYVLALGLILILRDYARRHPSPIVERAVLGTGIYTFAVLLINSYGTWLLLPIPFLVALLFASSWLFRPEEEVNKLRAIPENKRSRWRRLIQDVVDSGTATAQFAAIEKSLNSKLNSAEMTPEEYDGKLKDCRTYLEKKLELETVAPGVRSQEAVFAIGGSDLWSNVSAAVKAGAVLALGPFLIALYDFLPNSRVSYPYPLVTLLAFIVSASASWLLYAFFFGFYFVYLRGKSGLTKGIHLFFGLLLPFAVYRLLDTQSLTDMRSFFLWATQLFLFCTLLGLLAFDYRLLRSNQFRVRDLTAVHNVPALSAYVSTAVAALVPTAIALITGKFGDIMKFFVETVLGMPSGS